MSFTLLYIFTMNFVFVIRYVISCAADSEFFFRSVGHKFKKIPKMHKQPTGYAGPISGNRTCLRKQTQQTSLGFQDLFTAFITDYNSLCMLPRTCKLSRRLANISTQNTADFRFRIHYKACWFLDLGLKKCYVIADSTLYPYNPNSS